MSEMQIRPYEGIGPINFGMSKAEVRSAFGAPFREFTKSPMTGIPVDAFPTLGVHVYYKVPGICEAVEVASPTRPVLLGRTLVGQPFGELVRWLRELDPEMQVDEAGLTSLLFGMGLYAPGLKAGDSMPVESVIVFERGYYG